MDGVVFVYDLTRRKTFERIDSFWRAEVLEKVGREVPAILVGCKGDLLDSGSREVAPEEADSLARNCGMTSFECSAKTGDRVQAWVFLFS